MARDDPQAAWGGLRIPPLRLIFQIFRRERESSRLGGGEERGFEPSNPSFRTLTLNARTQSYCGRLAFSLDQSDVCVCPAKERERMKHNAFQRGNRKPGGRTHRSRNASRQELTKMTPDGHETKPERARRIQRLALMFMHRNGR
jgi:hypothetical protein